MSDWTAKFERVCRDVMARIAKSRARLAGGAYFLAASSWAFWHSLRSWRSSRLSGP